MAEALYNAITAGEPAGSAGYEVDKEGQLLIERAAQPGSETGKVIEAMNELGIDVSRYIRNQTTPELLAKYDKIIAILEPHETPDDLKDNPKVEFWVLPDPKGEGLESIRKSRDEIKIKVEELVSRIG